MQYHFICHCIQRNVILSIIKTLHVRAGSSALHLELEIRRVHEIPDSLEVYVNTSVSVYTGAV